MRTLKYSIEMHAELKTQKLRKTGIEDVVPAKKARAFVIEVIVIDGPAC